MRYHGGGRERLEPLWWVIVAVGAVLGLRLVQLQLVDSAEYRLAAERNRSEVIYQTAPRGRLYDRNGDLIATNRGAFSLIFLPGKNRSRRDLLPLALELGRQLHRDPKELLKTLEQAEHDQSVVRLAENLPKKTMFQLSELKTLYPGVDLVEEATRYYPHGRFASHLIGFMGKMNPAQWRELAPHGYRPDERIGQMGLERVFERELRGRDGGKRMEVDAQGRLKRELESIPWRAGGNVYLTIDTPVQEAADKGLRATATDRGAAVAIDPRDGELIALSSQPDFNPNALLSTNAQQASKAAATLPEFDKAIAGTYPPGSTFKPIVGLAALSSGRITPTETFFCPGWFKLGHHIFKCWKHTGHGRISFLNGLRESCDVYFYNVGLRTGGALIEKYEREFGLGSKTNIALRGEHSGHVFGPAQRRKEGRGWYDGDTVNLSIGQGELLVTPIQMAVVAAALANRGTVWRPHYTRRIVFADGRPDYVQKPEVMGRVRATPEAWDEVQEGMQLVVSSGTGYNARIPGLLVAGKTGTAQNPHGKDHGWFIAYAARPGQPASIAVAVLVENGGHGGVSAAPIARRMIEAYFGIPDPEDVRLAREAARRKARAAAEAALRAAAARRAAPPPAPAAHPLPVGGMR